jgi:hypothetical protein
METLSFEQMCSLLSSAATPVGLLEECAKIDDYFVRISIFLNPNCPQYVKDYIAAILFIKCYGNQF